MGVAGKIGIATGFFFVAWKAIGQQVPFIPKVIPFHLASYNRFTWHTASATVNPGALADNNRPSIFTYAENRFMIKELTHLHMGALVPLGTISALKTLLYFRKNPLGRDGALELGYTQRLDQKFSIGARFGLSESKIIGNKTNIGISTQAGFIHTIGDQITWGAQFRKDMPLGTGSIKSIGNSQLVFGIGYTLDKGFLLSHEFTHNLNGNLTARTAIYWKALKAISFQGGMTFPGGELFVQATKPIGKQQLTVGFNSNSLLGLSGGLLYEYSW